MLPDTVSGLIFLWSGTIVDIPDGWALCDGSNGTPDLRNKFVVAAGDTYAVDETGGLTSHDHRFRGDSHVHNVADGDINIKTADLIPEGVESAVAQGTDDSSNHLSPYYALAYIMFL